MKRRKNIPRLRLIPATCLVLATIFCASTAPAQDVDAKPEKAWKVGTPNDTQPITLGGWGRPGFLGA